MARIIIEMEFYFDGFDELPVEEKFEAIKEVLDYGAQGTCSELAVSSIKMINDNISEGQG